VLLPYPRPNGVRVIELPGVVSATGRLDYLIGDACQYYVTTHQARTSLFYVLVRLCKAMDVVKPQKAIRGLPMKTHGKSGFLNLRPPKDSASQVGIVFKLGPPKLAGWRYNRSAGL